MKKIDDWFFAGMVAGAIGGIGIFLLNIVLLLLGIEHTTYWQAMGGLYYNQELLYTGFAQIHGAIDAIGVSAFNGILLSLILLITGRVSLYSKSLVMSAVAVFLFIFVYPQTGLGKDSLITPWVALFGHTVSNGLLTGYILNKICSFKQPITENALNNSKKLRIYFLSNVPTKEQASKIRKTVFVKPKKL